eukprot:TRINITY_DN774223_c0_g1_i1.p1 TRINITY_DN774223_c0_g1~~TRINITY_DN774223_c0_g1_i1.p1  ORF type:complete len:372 (-),score=166.59 TRINITY_DN774223_c0_g1_i1:241-1356(-)
MSVQVLGAPGRYVQGSEAVKELARFCKDLGDKVFVLGGKRGLGAVRETIEETFPEKELVAVFEPFNGECCNTEVQRLMDKAKEAECNVICCAGGGKAIDAGKIAAHRLNLPVVVVPTIAATDAPCSALSVLYTEQGVYEEYIFFPKNPDVVLVDLDIIAKAPTRLLVSGMGDALATWFEAEQSAIGKKTNCVGGAPTLSALAICKLCYETLKEHGVRAKLACDRNAASDSLEKIVEANTLMSGLGFESGGLGAAHPIHNGLTAIEETHHYYHGEKVSFGTLAQLHLQGATTELIDEVTEFCLSVGLPVCLADIGVMNPTKDQLMEVARLASVPAETIHCMPFKITTDIVYAAIVAADAYGTMKKKMYAKRM